MKDLLGGGLKPNDPRRFLIEAMVGAMSADGHIDQREQAMMQKIVGDRLRPQGSTDPFGVEQARAQLDASYAIIEKDMARRNWAVGDAFGMADCAAMPALFYANKVQPFGERHGTIKAYHDRLLARPSAVRVIEEAGPYFKYFPYNDG